jgi:hypothetical protein
MNTFLFSAVYVTMSDYLHMKENTVKEEIGLNSEIASDDISNEINSHIRSADVEVASVNRFNDKLHVSII